MDSDAFFTDAFDTDAFEFFTSVPIGPTPDGTGTGTRRVLGVLKKLGHSLYR